MRCERCGRRARRLRSDRLPDGHLAFAWCADCLAEVHLQALGLEPPRPVIKEPPPRRDDTPARTPKLAAVVAASIDDGPAGLRGLAALLTAWGLLLELVGAGSWLGLGGPDGGFGPTRIGRGQVFAVSGAILAIAGAWTGLASLERGARAHAMARAVEAVALGLGFSALVAGIIFHDPSRDPWIIAGVLLAVIAARAARSWSRATDRSPRPLPSG
jgi:hypothetical protein